MLSVSFMLLISGAVMMLRMGESVSSFARPLNSREEQECIEKMISGDTEARNKLIEHNLRLVMHIIKKYYAAGSDTDDLISIGTIGLIKGVSTFRPDKGVRLATYASRCIENEILMYFRSQKKTANDVSLSGALEGEEEGEGLSLLDTLADEGDILDNLSRREDILYIRELVGKTLSGREEDIIRLRYGLNGEAPLSQREVAEKLGISRSYVSRIEKKALERLKAEMEKEGKSAQKDIKAK